MMASLRRALGLWSSARATEPSPRAGPGRDLLHSPSSLAGAPLLLSSALSPNWQNPRKRRFRGSSRKPRTLALHELRWENQASSSPHGIRAEENVSFQDSQWSFHLGFIQCLWASSSFMGWCNKVMYWFLKLSIKQSVYPRYKKILFFSF